MGSQYGEHNINLKLVNNLYSLSLSLSHENKLFISIEFFFLNKPKQHVCNEHYYDNTVQISIFQYTLFKKSIQYNTLIVTENGQRLCGKNCNEFKRQKLFFFRYMSLFSQTKQID